MAGESTNSRLTSVQIRLQNNQFTEEIPISVLASNIIYDPGGGNVSGGVNQGYSLVETLGNVNMNTLTGGGSLQSQIDSLRSGLNSHSNTLNDIPNTIRTWLSQNCTFDNSNNTITGLDTKLQTAGLAADAKAAGDLIKVSNSQPTEQSNKIWIKPSITSVAVPTMQDIENIIAPQYSNSSPYNIGDYVIHDDLLYRCTTLIGSAGETWTSGHWTQVNVGNQLKTIPAVDPTLAVSGKAADAAKTGEELSNLKSDLENNTISPEWTSGKYISDSDGSEISYASWSCTDFIEVSGNTLNLYMTIAYGSRYNAFYDENKTFISSFIFTESAPSVDVPDGAKYFRLSCETRYANSIKLYNYLVQRVDNLVQRVDNLDSAMTESTNDVKYDLMANTITPIWIPGEYISDSDGTVLEQSTWSRTDYLPVDADTVRFIVDAAYGTRYNAFYNENKVFISSFIFTESVKDVSVPDGAKYMRISCESRYTSNIKIYNPLAQTVDNHSVQIDTLSNTEIPYNEISGKYIEHDGTVATASNWSCGDYIEFDGGLLIVTNESETEGTTYNAFYDANKNFLSAFSIYPDRHNDEIVAPVGTKYFRYSNQTSVFDKVHFYLGSKNLFYNGDILRLNDKDTVGQRIIQSQMHYNPYDGSTISTKILTLSVFTDIHAFDTEFKRYIRFTNAYKDYVDDRLCLGDVVRDNFPQDFTYWTNNPDADEILIVLGNHDACTNENGQYIVQPTLSCYNKFFKDLIGNWNVTQPTGASTNGLCYYYKDYTDSNIRLIVLDCMHYTDAQNDWFISTLASARTAGLHVICAKHYNVSRDLTKVDGNFYDLDLGFEKLVIGDTNNNKAQVAVSDFQVAGGAFICWLTGDAHYDAIGELTMNGYKQLCVTFENAGCHDAWGDTARVVGEKSEDSFNIVSIDTYSHLLKIVRVGNDLNRFLQSKQYMCYNYQTNEVISVN